MILNNIKLIHAIPKWLAVTKKKMEMRSHRIRWCIPLYRTADDSRSAIYMLFKNCRAFWKHNTKILPCHGFSCTIHCDVEQKTILRRTKRPVTVIKQQTAPATANYIVHFFFFHSSFNLVRAHRAHAIAATVCVINLCTFWKRSTAIVVVTFRMHSEYVFLDLDSVLRFISLLIILFHSFAYGLCDANSFMHVLSVSRSSPSSSSLAAGIVTNEARVQFRQWRALKRAHVDGTRRRQICTTRRVSFFQYSFHCCLHATQHVMHCSSFNWHNEKIKLVQYQRRHNESELRNTSIQIQKSAHSSL